MRTIHCLLPLVLLSLLSAQAQFYVSPIEQILRWIYQKIVGTDAISFECVEAYVMAIINQDVGIIGSLLFTGKYVNNVGSYADCVKPDYGTDYYLYTLSSNSTSTLPLLDSRSDNHYMGLCVPSACSRSDVLHLQGILETFAEIEQVNYNNVTLTKLAVDAQPSIDAADPEGQAILVGVALAACIGAVFLSSLIVCCCNVKEKSAIAEEHSNELIDSEGFEEDMRTHAQPHHRNSITNSSAQFTTLGLGDGHYKNEFQKSVKPSPVIQRPDRDSFGDLIEQQRFPQSSDRGSTQKRERDHRVERPAWMDQSLKIERRMRREARKPSQLFHPVQSSICSELFNVLSLQGICKNMKNTIDPTKAAYTHELPGVAKRLRSWSPQHFSFIDGLKTLAMMWSILAVVYAETRSVPADNADTAIPAFFDNFLFTALVPGAAYATDIFLFFSGFLITYQILSMANQTKKMPSLLSIYLDRFMRLVPFVGICIAVFSFLTPYLGSGPFWNDTTTAYTSSCQANWWQNLLFIRNLYSDSKVNDCMWWLFYIQIEVQLFIITPLILKLFWYSRKAGIALILALMAASYCITAILMVQYNLGVSIILDESYYNIVFVKPYTSFDTYGLGLLVGIFYTMDYLTHEDDRTGFIVLQGLSQNACMRYASYIWGVIFTYPMTFLPYTYYQQYAKAMRENPDGDIQIQAWPSWASLLYVTFCRSIFVIGFMFSLVLPVLARKGSLVNAVCGCRGWAFVARFIFVVYLIGPWIVFLYYASEEHMLHLQHVVLVFLTAGMIVIIWLLSLCCGLCCQRPCTGLGKCLRRRVL